MNINVGKVSIRGGDGGDAGPNGGGGGGGLIVRKSLGINNK